MTAKIDDFVVWVKQFGGHALSEEWQLTMQLTKIIYYP